jgi:predicted ATP-binding protein involved in virulence
MYKISEVSMTGFWRQYKAHSDFKQDVNIIIGKNGTGKTTFMNILQAVLLVDMDALYENDFESVVIKLENGNSKRTIKADKVDTEHWPFPVVEYHISNKKFYVPLFSGDEIRISSVHRRKAHEESLRVKKELSQLVSLASLSVYRISGELEIDSRERMQKKVISPVDFRLQGLMQRLTHYQLELSNEAREISAELQKDVLMSLLYKNEADKEVTYNLDFDVGLEKRNLIVAYKQLGLTSADTVKQISEHINAITLTINNIKDSKNTEGHRVIDFAPLEAFRRTRKVVDMSLKAEKENKKIFSQVELFINTVKNFIPEKQLVFQGGDLAIHEKNGEIPISKLSSGEKQLLILFIEALLQKQKPYIFMADEPELSLHISWQRNIISAIRSLNPNAQIIVATHSPEVAGRFRDSILDMEDMLHV